MPTDNKRPPHPENDNTRPSPYDPDNPRRREPSFGGFDERRYEEYEEPDRDTTLTSGYSADDFDEEEELDLFADEDIDDPLEHKTDTATTMTQREESKEPEDEPEEWLEDDEYYEDDDDGDSGWPLRMIIVGAVAVALVTAGVYGVLQERAATEAELRDLRATLATSADQDDLRTTRDNLRALQKSHDTLQAKAEALTEENRQLKEAIAGLGEQPAPVKASAAPAPEEPETSTASTEPPPAPQPPAAPAATRSVTPKPATSLPGSWFVNFGSYSTQALAESWAGRLRPERGEVIVAPGTKDGKTYYRVRVVGLEDKGSADRVARELEAEQQVSRLWVGQD